MADEFKIEVGEWIPTEGGDPFERETTAEISIRVGPHQVTEVDDRRAKAVRQTIRASAGLLAVWLLSNWWRLRWEPYRAADQVDSLDWGMSHSIAASGGGYVWPPMTFLESDGVRMLLTCEAYATRDTEQFVAIRYLNSFTEVIDATSFEAGVVSFVDSVLARLHSRKIQHSVLHDLWADVLAERRYPTSVLRRKLEALLGLNPDEQEKLISSLVTQWRRKVGSEALEEIAAATEIARVESVLDAVSRAAQAVRTYAEIASFSDVREWTHAHPSLTKSIPWQLGRETAYVLRDLWNLGRKPVTNSDIADRLQVPRSKLDEVNESVPFSFGIRGRSEEKLGFVLTRRHEHSRRFDIARLIGDHLVVESSDSWKPATHSLTARQKFQRAFAAEFLLPSETLVQRYSSPIRLDDLGEIAIEVAEEYNVSQQVVIYHLENRGLLPRSANPDLRLFGWLQFPHRPAPQTGARRPPGDPARLRTRH